MSFKFEKGMKMVVLGGGESGVGAALLAKKLGYDVYVSDAGKIKDSYKKELKDNKIRLEEGGHKLEWLLNVHVAIKSPGVPDHSPPIRSLRECGIPFFSEIEFGYHFYTGSLLAVTGSNGKTTTSGLLGHVLTSAGLETVLCGNIGISFCRILAEQQPDYVVLEVSSFQLDNIESFRPDVAVLLNITADHLDRYDYRLDLYAEAKMKITQNQSADDVFIYNADDLEITNRIDTKGSNAKRIGVTSEDFNPSLIRLDGRPFDFALQGKHNRFNGACVICAARTLGLDDNQIERGLSTYSNYPHRLEVVGQHQGVTYVNDSKATNVDAVFFALDAIEGSVIWIAGGTDKGNDYAQIRQLVNDKVKAIICLGVDNSKLQSFAESFQDKDMICKQTQEVQHAVKLAKAEARPGDTILLSPACASFDLFKNYMDRGDQFKAAVQKEIKTI